MSSTQQTYVTVLPQVFPHGFSVSRAVARAWVRELMSQTRTDVPDGSSFAVTVDAADGAVTVWLSEVSWRHLASLHFEEHPL